MYKDVLDDELLFLIEENEERAFQELIERYSPKINIIISKYKEKALQIGFIYKKSSIYLMRQLPNWNKKLKFHFIFIQFNSNIKKNTCTFVTSYAIMTIQKSEVFIK